MRFLIQSLHAQWTSVRSWLCTLWTAIHAHAHVQKVWLPIFIPFNPPNECFWWFAAGVFLEPLAFGFQTDSQAIFRCAQAKAVNLFLSDPFCVINRVTLGHCGGPSNLSSLNQTFFVEPWLLVNRSHVKDILVKIHRFFLIRSSSNFFQVLKGVDTLGWRLLQASSFGRVQTEPLRTEVRHKDRQSQCEVSTSNLTQIEVIEWFFSCWEIHMLLEFKDGSCNLSS